MMKAKVFLFILFSCYGNSFAQDSEEKYFEVTASKISNDLSTQTSSIEIIESDDVFKGSNSSLSNVLEGVSGVYISNAGEFGGVSTIRARGSEAGLTKVVIDEFELEDPTDINHSLQVNHFSFMGVSSVEVLKGNQSSLYGSDSIGSVVKLNTKDLSDRNFLGLGFGEKDTREIYSRLAKRQDKVELQTDVSWLKSDGISKYNSTRLSSAENDPYSRLDFQGKFLYHFNNSHRIKVLSKNILAKHDIDGFGSDIVDSDQSVYDYSLLGTMFYGRALSDLLEYKLIYQENKVVRNEGGAYPGVYTGLFKKYAIDSKLHLYDNYKQSFGLSFEERKTSISNEFKDKRSSNYGSFYTGHYSLKDFRIFTDHSIRIDHHANAKDNMTYRVGIGKKLFDNEVLKVSYATGVKNPTEYQLHTNFGGNKNLKATRAKSFEVTFLGKLNDIIGHEITYFNTKYKNKIAYSNSNYENISNSSSYGGEFILKLEAFGRLKFQSALTKTWAKDELTGEYLPKTPRTQVTSSLRYSFLDNLFIQIKSKYVGERNDGGRMPSYSTYDLSLNYTLKNTSVSLIGKNIFDKKYEDTRTYGTLGRSLFVEITQSL